MERHPLVRMEVCWLTLHPSSRQPGETDRLWKRNICSLGHTQRGSWWVGGVKVTILKHVWQLNGWLVEFENLQLGQLKSNQVSIGRIADDPVASVNIICTLPAWKSYGCFFSVKTDLLYAGNSMEIAYRKKHFKKNNASRGGTPWLADYQDEIYWNLFIFTAPGRYASFHGDPDETVPGIAVSSRCCCGCGCCCCCCWCSCPSSHCSDNSCPRYRCPEVLLHLGWSEKADPW